MQNEHDGGISTSMVLLLKGKRDGMMVNGQWVALKVGDNG